jgi:hypothetical protein
MSSQGDKKRFKVKMPWHEKINSTEKMSSCQGLVEQDA